MEPNDQRRRSRFANAVLTRGSLLDAALMVAVPAVLVAVYLLPLSVRRAMTFEYGDPTLLTAFTAHFVHLSAGHLGANLAGYALLVPTAYLLSALAGRRRLFRVVFVGYLLALPLALSGLNALQARSAVGYGFSGVVLGYLGYLPMAVFHYTRSQVEERIERNYAPALFLVGLALVAVVIAPGVETTLAVAAVALVAAGLYGVSFLRRLDRSRVFDPRSYVVRAGYTELGVVSVAVFLLYPFAAFPRQPLAGGARLSLLTHLLGYTFGFVAVYAFSTLTGYRVQRDPGAGDGETEVDVGPSSRH